MRNQFKRAPAKPNEIKIVQAYSGEPYAQVKAKMLQISRLESPMSKLEWVYTCCTQAIPSEVSEFWRDFDIPSKKLSIDTD